MKTREIMQTAGTARPVFMEHRWGQRMPCRATVRICAGMDASGMGRIRDISTSGAFIETTTRFPPSSPISLLILGNASASHAVEISAIVVRTEPDGVGVEWCETPAGFICANVGCTTRCAALDAVAHHRACRND